jgi:hypothetical protein
MVRGANRRAVPAVGVLDGPPEAGTRWDGATGVKPFAPLSFMQSADTVKSARTVFLPIPLGDIWRVQIVWSNASVLFGRFASEREASEWIANHAWWAEYKLKPPEDDVGG